MYLDSLVRGFTAVKEGKEVDNWNRNRVIGLSTLHLHSQWRSLRSPLVDALLRQMPRNHEYIREHRPRRHGQDATSLLPGRLVDGVVANQSGRIPQQECDEFLFGSADRPPETDFQPMRAGYDGQMGEPVTGQYASAVPVQAVALYRQPWSAPSLQSMTSSRVGYNGTNTRLVRRRGTPGGRPLRNEYPQDARKVAVQRDCGNNRRLESARAGRLRDAAKLCHVRFSTYIVENNDVTRHQVICGVKGKNEFDLQNTPSVLSNVTSFAEVT